jgi:hypothetical protein
MIADTVALPLPSRTEGIPSAGPPLYGFPATSYDFVGFLPVFLAALSPSVGGDVGKRLPRHYH